MAATQAVRFPLRLPSRMMPTDALFWYAEEATPELRPLVGGLFVLDRPPDRARFRASVERALVCIPRLRQRVVEAPLGLGLPQWEDDPHFEVDYHVREVLLPEPAAQHELFEFAGAMFATPLDHLRPLWEGYLVEGLEGGRAAYFFKAHHAIVDGVGSVAMFEVLTQAHRADPIRIPRRASARPRPRPDVGRWEALLRDNFARAGTALVAGAQLAIRAALRPKEVAEDLVRAARGIRGLMRDLNAPLLPDPLAAHASGYCRRLDGLTFSLPRLRRINEALSVTLNDLVLTAVSGALGRYHEHHHIHVDRLHCMVPINLRQSEERAALGNRIGMCNITLPVGERDPFLRLEGIQFQTAEAKGDRRGAAYPILMQGLAFLPAVAFRALVELATGRINLICTNVPGPCGPRYLAGAKIETLYPFAPVMIGTPLSVALLSYGDVYAVGIATDPAAIPDPELLHKYFEQEINDLERKVLPRTMTIRPARSHAARRRAGGSRAVPAR